MSIISHSHSPARTRAGGSLPRLMQGLSEMLLSLGAAIRLARAVEAHLEPDPADLRRLGIRQGLPRSC